MRTHESKRINWKNSNQDEAEKGDGSYTEDPIFIAYADDDFIVYHTVYGDGENMVIESKPLPQQIIGMIPTKESF